MAERPVFVPTNEREGYVKQLDFNIAWAGGFAAVQKQKNIRSLHNAAERRGYAPLLEVSSKSDEKAGRHLSAFHLRVPFEDDSIPLENAFQGSKVFEDGGPFIDLYHVDPREAKRDARLKEAGRLVGFRFESTDFPLTPTTIFYDWLYLSAVLPYREWLMKRITSDVEYAGFTDIEFNPAKSVNCQAKSCALFVSLMRENKLEQYMASPEIFISSIEKHMRSIRPHDLRRNHPQLSV
ncbi:DarT1-associated NADAR antitoxin family protein [Rhizobium johnstonii]|uniref:DarT1-associated NADAR antitoxin family protein n=1 Tax=Rhizobium johnstonii TaxID=3019933 RepID=UPI003F94D42A